MVCVHYIIVTRVQDIKAGVAIFLVEPRPFLSGWDEKKKKKNNNTAISLQISNIFLSLYVHSSG